MPADRVLRNGTVGSPDAAADGDTRDGNRVPDDPRLRERLRQKSAEFVAEVDRAYPPGKQDLADWARQLLEAEGQPSAYQGWLMVMLTSGFWQNQVAQVPYTRRLLLLPSEEPAGLNGHDRPNSVCATSATPSDTSRAVQTAAATIWRPNSIRQGAAQVPQVDRDHVAGSGEWRSLAQQLGYRVLHIHQTGEVQRLIREDQVDAIVGVAELGVLEKALDTVLIGGLPGMAEPLRRSAEGGWATDDDWVRQMIETPFQSGVPGTRTFRHLLRGAGDLFRPGQLERLLPGTGRDWAHSPTHSAKRLLPDAITVDLTADPLNATAAIAYDFLGRGGKLARPFITLAVYDAMTGGHATAADGRDVIAQWPVGVKRTAMSIEVFHKASLVHDDIEDDDDFRYGQPTLHKRFGIPNAINIGDYLVGLGYRLVSGCASDLGGSKVADILDCLAAAHQRLSEGQGAELIWRGSHCKWLDLADALQIYALKTAPAFEVALYSGLRLAGDATAYHQPICQFARCLGIAFQILNDLQDWCEDGRNKVSAGGDVLEGRPTLLLALALQNLPAEEQSQLLALLDSAHPWPASRRLAEVRRRYQAAGAFQQALRLVDDYQQSAKSIAVNLEPRGLRQLLLYLIQSVLRRPAAGPAAH